MNIDQFFTLMNGIAGIGWLLIIVTSPFWKRYDLVVISIAVLLAVAYVTFNIIGFRPDIFQKFSTLGGVMDLFVAKPFVMAAWSHILAFDLIGGVWMKKNSVKHGIKHWVMLPTFIFTFVLGPFGFIIYIITRWIKTGRFFAEN